MYSAQMLHMGDSDALCQPMIRLVCVYLLRMCCRQLCRRWLELLQLLWLGSLVVQPFLLPRCVFAWSQGGSASSYGTARFENIVFVALDEMHS